MQKLYAYVDESGQDTEGKLFLVSVVVLEEERERVRLALRDAERHSRKGLKKWTNSRQKERDLYMQRIVTNPDLLGRMYYAHYKHSRSYIELTIMTIAKAVFDRDIKGAYQTTVLVDGLKHAERPIFGSGLRKLGIAVRKVRGVRDQSDEFIRLADAIAGFVRDALEGNEKMSKMYKGALKRGVLKEL
ncbi:MAG TPA: DUF3800 domain-containing protein [Candidatus Paceibacterota bacterium]